MKKNYVKSEYSKKLLDPRWQKKRLEILSRDEFTCQSCYDKESTLHVHHCYYERGKEPWEYPCGSLITLCDGCHEYETEHSYETKILLSNTLADRGLLSNSFIDLACAFSYAFRLDEMAVSAIAWAIKEPEMLEAIINARTNFLAEKRKINDEKSSPKKIMKNLNAP